MIKEIDITDISGLDEAAGVFAEAIGNRRVVAFDAPMGSGKTTFISALCRKLGVETDDISSPTFAIINEYISDRTGEHIYHFDCYRLESMAEAMDMGMEDYLYSGALCLIEWPEVIEEMLPADAVRAEIVITEEGKRVVRVRY